MADIRQTIGPMILFFFMALVAIIAITALYNYFSNRLKLKVVQSLLKDNKDLTPEQIHAIFQRKSNKDSRKGYLSIALAFASVLFGIIMGSAGYKLAQTSLIGMAMFPGLIGLTFLYFQKNNK